MDSAPAASLGGPPLVECRQIVKQYPGVLVLMMT